LGVAIAGVWQGVEVALNRIAGPWQSSVRRMPRVVCCPKVCCADFVLPVLSDVPAFRLQGVSDRRTTYVSAAPARVMIDNTHVVVLRGAGRDLIAISSDLSAAQNESNIRIGHGA
jgi:hypothetical protein